MIPGLLSPSLPQCCINMAICWMARSMGSTCREQYRVWCWSLCPLSRVHLDAFHIGRDYILFPALAGFLILAPFLAIGLYEKSRALAEGRQISFGSMLKVRAHSGAQIFFLGLLLCLLLLLWMPAAVLLWALFFGVTVFPGLGAVTGLLFATLPGLSLLIVGIRRRWVVRSIRVLDQRLCYPDDAGPARRCLNSHGNEL